MIRILVQEGRGERATHLLDGSVVRLGRDPSNQVVIRDRFVSGRHGEIRIGADGLTYEDFVTTNGSRVRRQGKEIPVDATCGHRLLLRAGDELLLGDKQHPVCVRFELTPAVVFGSRGIVAPPRDQPVAMEFEAALSETMVLIPAGFDREVLLSLHRLTARLSAGLELAEIVKALTESTLEVFPKASHVSVWLRDDETDDFVPLGARSRHGAETATPVSRTVRDEVLSRGKALAFDDAQEGFDIASSLHDSNVRAGMCAPLWDGRRVAGLVQVDCRGFPAHGAFRQADLETLAVFAHQGAMAIANARLHAGLRRSVEQAITGLVAALEAKDTYTAGHSAAVAELCVAACGAMGLSASMTRSIRRAALLHDLGKIAVPFDILNKPGQLTPDEFKQLKAHPETGARILAPFDFLREVVPIVLHHHERWDGKGYPRGLKGEEIPLGARVLAACDAWHSLVHDRAYRKAVPAEVAMAEMRRAAGTQFDPAVIEALAETFENTGDTALRPEAVGVP